MESPRSKAAPEAGAGDGCGCRGPSCNNSALEPVRATQLPGSIPAELLAGLSALEPADPEAFPEFPLDSAQEDPSDRLRALAAPQASFSSLQRNPSQPLLLPEPPTGVPFPLKPSASADALLLPEDPFAALASLVMPGPELEPAASAGSFSFPGSSPASELGDVSASEVEVEDELLSVPADPASEPAAPAPPVYGLTGFGPVGGCPNSGQPPALLIPRCLKMKMQRRQQAQLPPGGILEPCCHFFSNLDPEKLFSSLMDILVVMGIDYDPDLAKFHMVCMAYRGGSRVCFHIQVFQTPCRKAPGAYAVELQRRCGDIVHFCEVYRLVYQAMRDQGLVAAESLPVVLADEAADTPCALFGSQKEHGAVAGSGPQEPESGGQKLSLPPPPPLPEEDQLKLRGETLQCLISLAKSEAVDMKGQAIQALCELSSPCHPDLQELIVQGEALHHMVRALDCPDQDVHRPALTGIADLVDANVQNVAQRLLAEGAICKLFKLSMSPVRQVARESARALASVAARIDRSHVCAAVDCYETCLRDLISHCQLDPRADGYSRSLATITGFSRLLEQGKDSEDKLRMVQELLQQEQMLEDEQP